VKRLECLQERCKFGKLFFLFNSSFIVECADLKNDPRFQNRRAKLKGFGQTKEGRSNTINSLDTDDLHSTFSSPASGIYRQMNQSPLFFTHRQLRDEDDVISYNSSSSMGSMGSLSNTSLHGSPTMMRSGSNNAPFYPSPMRFDGTSNGNMTDMPLLLTPQPFPIEDPFAELFRNN
jgi:hypothetical protein